MRLSEFRRAVASEFGESIGAALVRDLVLDELDGKTAQLALTEGRPVREVWLALCRANGVPRERWYAVGLIEPH